MTEKWAKCPVLNQIVCGGSIFTFNHSDFNNTGTDYEPMFFNDEIKPLDEIDETCFIDNADMEKNTFSLDLRKCGLQNVTTGNKTYIKAVLHSGFYAKAVRKEL